MQTRRQSTFEVIADFGFSILINIGGQLVFYHELATPRRVTLFASILLLLAFVRRLATRRLFEAFTSPSQGQPRWHSALEAVSDTLLGFGIAVALQMLLYGEVATLLRASSLTCVIYGLTMLRRYLLRRLFAAWAMQTG